MPVATWSSKRTGQDEWDRASPAPWQDAEDGETPSAGYLPPPAWHFPITDAEQWIDLCA